MRRPKAQPTFSKNLQQPKPLGRRAAVKHMATWAEQDAAEHSGLSSTEAGYQQCKYKKGQINRKALNCLRKITLLLEHCLYIFAYR
jgi:hypothetical protein